MVADAGLQWAIYLGVNGRLPEAQTHWDRCIPLARSSANRAALASGLTYQGVKHFWESEYEIAEATQLEAAGLAAEIRDGFYLPLALFYLGLTRANRGRLSDAMASLDEALNLAKRNNNAVALSRVPNGCGWVWREIGDLGKAISSTMAAPNYPTAEGCGSRVERVDQFGLRLLAGRGARKGRRYSRKSAPAL